MLSGGGDNKTAKRNIRMLSALITPVLALYTILISVGVIPAATHTVMTPIGSVGLAVLWVALCWYYYFREATTKSDQALRMVMHHILAILLFTLVIGFWQPFAALFVLLFIAAYIYFGRKGLIFSVLSFVVAGSIDILIRFPYQPYAVFEIGLPIFSIVILGVSVLGLITSQDSRQRALLHSRQRERLQYDRVLTIMNNLSDAAFSTDEHGKIMLYNAASLDLLDTNDSIRGKFIGDILSLTTTDNEKTNLFEILQSASRSSRRDDINHTYKDGESIRLELSYAPIRSNYSLSKKGEEQGGYIVIVRDVTKQKSLEEERDEFISVVSHELRTPITIVEGTLSNLELLMQRPEADKKMLSSTVTTAHDQVLYLARMVNDLSTLSRAERGIADAPEEIDVSHLLHGLHNKYTDEAKVRKLQLNLDLGVRLGNVNASRLYLEELLQNFITNAIKYTNEGSVTIIAKRAKGIVTFSVKDTGIGMSRTDQAKVFDKFYRSEDYRIRETNGTGLGLYVSTKLAHKLHTRIVLTSRINHGSTFSFELPVESNDLSK